MTPRQHASTCRLVRKINCPEKLGGTELISENQVIFDESCAALALHLILDQDSLERRRSAIRVDDDERKMWG